jgi:very-short-patch-repair endonuclease
MSNFARSLRQRSTKAEQTVWRWLRNRTMFGLKFRRQHPVGNYILDFYCAELKLCIEVDGGVHELFAKAMHDVERSGELSKLDIHVVRVRNEDVFRQPTATWDFLVGAVVRVLCEKTGRREMDVLQELHEDRGSHGPSP